MGKGADSSSYGRVWAPIYERWAAALPEPGACVDVLAKLAGEGLALELGIGNGRVALPLKARGIEVHGVESSTEMLDLMRRKPGGGEIPVIEDDFTRFSTDQRYSLIYVVLHTLFLVTEPEGQLRCFENASRHLIPGGRFLIEVFFPNSALYSYGQRIAVPAFRDEAVELNLQREDRALQQVSFQHVVLDRNGIELYPTQMRYAWPAELDLMARLAGLSLEQRRGGWNGEAFGADSQMHVSVYRKD